MPVSKRKFYRTVIRVEVLSEDPFDFNSLADVAAAIDDGPCSGSCDTVVDNQPVRGKRMAKLLEDQGSDPGFFNLTEGGEDADE